MKEAALFKAVFGQLQGNFAVLSKQKFSSNVIEKCLAMPYPDEFEAKQSYVIALTLALAQTQTQTCSNIPAAC